MADIQYARLHIPSSRRRQCAGVRSLGLLWLVLFTSACHPGADAEPPGGKAPMPDREDSAASSTLVQVAKADLARRVDADPSEITLVEVREVTWRDGSLGCPQPGMRYTQALVNGSQITLEFGGQIYYYHSGGGRGPFYCASPEMPLGEGEPEPFGDM